MSTKDIAIRLEKVKQDLPPRRAGRVGRLLVKFIWQNDSKPPEKLPKIPFSLRFFLISILTTPIPPQTQTFSGRYVMFRLMSSRVRSLASLAETARVNLRCLRFSRKLRRRRKGRVEIHGRTSSLLEVGTGFSSRIDWDEKNVYLKRHHFRHAKKGSGSEI